MTEAAPAEQAVAVEKKKRLFHRIPTSLLVTLSGIALTAWLLPAFTRQWDDRQKAHEVKAALAAQIAAATADAVTTGLQMWQQKADQYAPPGGKARIAKSPFATPTFARRAEEDLYVLYEPWLRSRFNIDAKLRASFPANVSKRMHDYNAAVYEMMEIASSQAASGLTGGALWTDAAAQWAAPLGITTKRFRKDTNETMRAVGGASSERGIGARAYLDISSAVLDLQNELISAILAAHVTGYSTTTHDLLHELIPWTP